MKSVEPRILVVDGPPMKGSLSKLLEDFKIEFETWTKPEVAKKRLSLKDATTRIQRLEVTSSKEIQEWNASVDARKRLKKLQG